MNLTREQRITRHKSFLNANWKLLASFAWEHCLEEGRGMVVVPEEDFVHAPVPELKGLRFAYAAKESDLLSEVSAHFEEKEWGWLESYDPDEKVIVIILREGGGTSGYLVGGRPSPSSCFAEKLAEQN